MGQWFRGFSLNILGGNSFMWNMKHNVVHHAYTNVDGIDDDIDIQPWMRMSETQKKYKSAQISAFVFLVPVLHPLYLLDLRTGLPEIFQEQGRVDAAEENEPESIILCSGVLKLFHAFMFVALPIYRLGWYDWLISFAIFTWWPVLC
jgi:linoleoyl-CoA desaturase